MSSFLNKGRRKDVRKSSKRIMKSVNNILAELQTIAEKVISNKDVVNEDNVVEVAGKYSKLTMGKFERSILLNKINHFKEEAEKLNKDVE